MTIRKIKILLVSILAACTLGVFGSVGPLVHATSCSTGHNATAAWSQCSGLPAGYYQRVRAHYVTGISSGGYVYGPWYSGALVSYAYHSNIDSAVTQTCAGGGCP